MTASDDFQIERLSGKEQTADDRLGLRDWAAVLLRLVVAVVFFEDVPFEPKQRVVVRARATGQVVLMHDWGRNGQGARIDFEAMTAACEQLSLADFAQENGVACGATGKPCTGVFAADVRKRPHAPPRPLSVTERISQRIATAFDWAKLTPLLRFASRQFWGVDEQKPVATLAPADPMTTCWCATRDGVDDPGPHP